MLLQRESIRLELKNAKAGDTLYLLFLLAMRVRREEEELGKEAAELEALGCNPFSIYGFRERYFRYTGLVRELEAQTGRTRIVHVRG